MTQTAVRDHAIESARGRALLSALREADEDGGLTLAEIQELLGTRWPKMLITVLCRAGYVIGEYEGRYVLVHDPGSSGASGDRPPGREAGLSRPGNRAGAPGDSEQARLFELPSRVHHRAEIAA